MPYGLVAVAIWLLFFLSPNNAHFCVILSHFQNSLTKLITVIFDQTFYAFLVHFILCLYFLHSGPAATSFDSATHFCNNNNNNNNLTVIFL